jgi:uncharacterized protein YPO0396
MTAFILPPAVEALIAESARTIAAGVVIDQISSALENDDVNAALEVISQTLQDIDQAIIDGFAGRDIELGRLNEALEAASQALDNQRAVRDNSLSEIENAGLGPLSQVAPFATSNRAQLKIRELNEAIEEINNSMQERLNDLGFGRDSSSPDPATLIPSVSTPELSNLSTSLADILAELQKIGICTCAEDKGGSDAGAGTGAAIPGVTRLSADASAFVFQIGKFLSGVKRALCGLKSMA